MKANNWHAITTGIGAALLALIVAYTNGNGVTSVEWVTVVLAFLVGAGFVSLTAAHAALSDAQDIQKQLQDTVAGTTLPQTPAHSPVVVVNTTPSASPAVSTTPMANQVQAEDPVESLNKRIDGLQILLPGLVRNGDTWVLDDSAQQADLGRTASTERVE